MRWPTCWTAPSPMTGRSDRDCPAVQGLPFAAGAGPEQSGVMWSSETTTICSTPPCTCGAFSMRRATTFFSSTRPTTCRTGQSHVLGAVLQEQPDRCQTGHRQRKKRTENCVDKGRQGLSGSAPGGNEAGPPPGFSAHRTADRGSHPTDQPSGHRTGRSRLPAAGAFAGAGWHGLFARAAEGAAPTAV